MDSSKCSLDILHSGSSHSSTEKLTKLAEHLTVTQIERDMLKDKISQLQKDGVIEVGNGGFMLNMFLLIILVSNCSFQRISKQDLVYQAYKDIN